MLPKEIIAYIMSFIYHEQKAKLVAEIKRTVVSTSLGYIWFKNMDFNWRMSGLGFKKVTSNPSRWNSRIFIHSTFIRSIHAESGLTPYKIPLNYYYSNEYVIYHNLEI